MYPAIPCGAGCKEMFTERKEPEKQTLNYSEWHPLARCSPLADILYSEISTGKFDPGKTIILSPVPLPGVMAEVGTLIQFPDEYCQVINRSISNPSIKMAIDGFHPSAYSLSAALNGKIEIHYPNDSFYLEALKRDALIPLSVPSRHGYIPVRADEIFPFHTDLRCLPGGEVISKSRMQIVGRIIDQLVFVSPLPGSFIAEHPLLEPGTSIHQVTSSSLTAFEPNSIIHLRNLSLDNVPRYDFSGTYAGTYSGYHLIFRSPPGTIVHHKSGRTFGIDSPEILLIPENECHAISISFDRNYTARKMYININIPPEAGHQTLSWQDTELDLEVFRGHDGRWYPLLLDLDEFLEASFADDVKERTVAEISRLVRKIFQGEFPFIADYSEIPEMQNLLDQYSLLNDDCI